MGVSRSRFTGASLVTKTVRASPAADGGPVVVKGVPRLQTKQLHRQPRVYKPWRRPLPPVDGEFPSTKP
jgi:hypothetical protein